jgi:hypothetical protein
VEGTKMAIAKIPAVWVLTIGLMVCWPSAVVTAEPVGSAFTYQGYLYDSNEAANNSYNFRFKLYDRPGYGTGLQVGNDVNVSGVNVVDGFFTVGLDFGSDPNIFNGDARWLEIGLNPSDTNSFTTLTPRQKVTPAPYALYAKTAGSIADETICGPPSATIVVAAYNSLRRENVAPRYRCAENNASTAIQNAVDDVEALGGGEVHLLEGLYKVNKTYTIGSAAGCIALSRYGDVGDVNLVISGCGKATLLWLNDNQNCSIFRIDGDDIGNITIKDLAMNGNWANNTTSACCETCGVKAWNTSGNYFRNFTVENCWIDDFDDYGLCLKATFATVRNCTLGDATRAVVYTACSKGRILNNTVKIDDTSGNVFRMDYLDSVCIGNSVYITLTGSTAAVIYLPSTGHRMLVADNFIDAWYGYSREDAWLYTTASRTIVTGNNICGRWPHIIDTKIMAGKCIVANNTLTQASVTVNNTTGDNEPAIVCNNTWHVEGTYTSPDIIITAGYADVHGNKTKIPHDETRSIKLYNASGATCYPGDVVIAGATGQTYTGLQFTTTTTQGDDKVVGIVIYQTAHYAYGDIQTIGKNTAVRVNGINDIAIGDFLCTYTEPGIAAKAGPGDMAFAIALEAYTTDDSYGEISALLITPRKLD